MGPAHGGLDLPSCLGRRCGHCRRPLVLTWLGCAAAGKESYDAFLTHITAWYGLVVLIGLTWAFANHACSGIRHLLLDTGAGYELKSNRMWSIVSLVSGVLITAIIWLIYFYGRL